MADNNDTMKERVLDTLHGMIVLILDKQDGKMVKSQKKAAITAHFG